MDLGRYLESILNAFDNAQHEYCILRNYSNFPEKDVTTKYQDVDILVHEKNLKILEDILKNHIKDKKINFKKITKEYVVTYRLYSLENIEKFEALQLDVHVRGQSFWGFYYRTEDEILSKRKKIGTIYVADPDDQALFNLLDKFLWGKYFKEKYMPEIHARFGNFESELKQIFGPLLTNSFKASVLTTDIEAARKLHKQMWTRLVLFSLRKNFGQTLKFFTQFVFFEIKKYLVLPGFEIRLQKSDDPERVRELIELLEKLIIGTTYVVEDSHSLKTWFWKWKAMSQSNLVVHLSAKENKKSLSIILKDLPVHECAYLVAEQYRKNSKQYDSHVVIS